MTALRIALATDWYAPRLGGIEAQLRQLAARLSASGHQVDVLTTTPGPEMVDGARVVRLEGARLPLAGISVSPSLASRLRDRLRGAYDVVHAHVSVVSPLGYVSAWVARSLGLPAVVTFHSVLHAKQALLAAADAVAGIGASAVVWSGVSELVARQAARALAVPVTELPNGFDPADWRPAAGAPPPPVTIVTASRLHRKKRVRTLVHAFARAVGRAGVPARLVICGDGPERASLGRAAADLRDGQGVVELPGWCDATQLRAVFAGAHAFALASRNEAFGIAALEARASGLPVLAMRHAGCAEFLRDDPGAVLCEDDDAMAAAITAVLRDPLRLRGHDAAGRLRRYEWDAVVRAHEGAYARAMALARRGGRVAS